jgi:hypothetical protein
MAKRAKTVMKQNSELKAVKPLGPVSPVKLIEDAVAAKGNEEFLAQIRDRATEIVSTLERSPELATLERTLESADPDWLSQVYAAIAEGLGRKTVFEDTLSAELFKATAEDERSVGAAYKEVFVADLPDYLKEIPKWFSGATRVDAHHMEDLRKTPDVQAGLPESEHLIPYGVTPRSIVYASDGISALLNRRTQAGGSSEFTISVNDPDSKLAAALEREVALIAECSTQTAKALVKWLIAAAQYKPYLFPGFIAELRQGGILLKPTSESYDNLYQRWSNIEGLRKTA